MKQLFIYGFILIFMGSCFTSKRKDINGAAPTCMTINNGSDNFLYYDFPNRDRHWEGCDIKDEFTDGCIRLGKISMEGYKEGKFITTTCGYFMTHRKRFFKEENFKNGLRDGIYKIINEKNDVVYSTTFEKGTGVWKEFHG